MVENVNHVADEIKRDATTLLRGTQKAVSDVASEVKSIAITQVEKQKDHLASELNLVSRALSSASETLSKEGAVQGGALVEKIVDRITTLSDSLRKRDLEQIVEDTRLFATNRPIAYIIAALAIGFVAARFFKSNATSGA